MVTLIYVDTDVILNFLLNRKNEYGKPLGPEAEEFFCKVFVSPFEILISRKTLEELYGTLHDTNKAKMLFEMLKSKQKLRIVQYNEEDLKEAESIDCENRNDALHALLARKNGAAFVVTRNMRHFRNFSHIIEAKFPKDV